MALATTIARNLAVLLFFGAALLLQPSCGGKKDDGWNRSTNGVWDE